MIQEYQIEGITCNNCVESIKSSLLKLAKVSDVTIDKDAAFIKISMNSLISLPELQEALPEKYKLSEILKENSINKTTDIILEGELKSKIEQLKPLLLILFYLSIASNLIHAENWNLSDVMLDFMGLFFIVFSFFKFLDLKGFPVSFQMYDPLARRVPIYAKIYPFVEALLGLMFLFRFKILIALILTLLILGITTIGVAKTLLDKKSIRCACLGTVLKLPMTEATIIENVLMIVMSLIMLFSYM